MTSIPDRLRALFRVFGATQCRGRSAVYEALSAAVADDDSLLDLLMDTPGDQRRPALLFGAVNYVLASHPEAELAAYYPVHGGRRLVDARLGPAFAAFCADRDGQLRALLRDRSTQTNEVRRCVALRLGLAQVARRWPGPVALAEVGASAGLNLLFDHYRYRVGGQEATSRPGSPVLISCDLRDRQGLQGRKGLRGLRDHRDHRDDRDDRDDESDGGGGGGGGADPAGFSLGGAPEVTSRLGIDRQPVDLADPAERAWLEAFVWPEDVDGITTLRAAMDVAVSAGPPPVVRGDATTDTARLLAGLPGQEPVVIFTASLLSYLSADGRAAFARQLQEVARRRPVAWGFAEGPGLLATSGLRVPALAGPLAQRNTLYLVGVSLREAGRQDDVLLALADPYLRWLAPAGQPTDDFEWLPSAISLNTGLGLAGDGTVAGDL